MRFAFTEDQRLLESAFKDLLEKECTPSYVRRAWGSEPRTRELWTKLAELGAIGLTVPEEQGGMGLSELELSLLLEAAGYYALPEPFLETTAVAAPLLRELGGDAAKVLPAIASGETIVSVGLEDGAFVLDVDRADLVLLARKNVFYSVPARAVKATRKTTVDGARRLFEIEWSEKQATVLASGDVAARAIATAKDRGALASALELVGLARRMLAITVDYVKVREQFGKPIGSFQAVKHHLANALLAIEFAKPLAYRAAYSMAHGAADRSLHVSMAKAHASVAADVAARASLQCHGAIGYSFEHDLHLFMKRSWSLAADWGSAASHREKVAAKILDAREERAEGRGE